MPCFASCRFCGCFDTVGRRIKQAKSIVSGMEKLQFCSYHAGAMEFVSAILLISAKSAPVIRLIVSSAAAIFLKNSDSGADYGTGSLPVSCGKALG